MFIFPPRFSLSLAHLLPLDHWRKTRKISVNESRSFTPSGQLKCRKCASFGGDTMQVYSNRATVMFLKSTFGRLKIVNYES
jgi:hypothetical protein